jgi:uncharacterized OsmC-like protein
MTTRERIKTAFERNARALELRPAIGRNTAVTRVRLREGLTCDVEEGPWKLVADMGEKHGGANLGPNPGVYGRTALGSCIAISYATWAAKLGVPITALEVEIQADYDSRGHYGLEDIPPGYREVRYVVNIQSPAPEHVVRHLADTADRHTSYLDVFAKPQVVKRELHITGSGGEV